MELIIAFVVLAAGAALALRTAVGTPPAAEPVDAAEPQAIDAAAEPAPDAPAAEIIGEPNVVPVALLPAPGQTAHPNGDAPADADTITAPGIPPLAEAPVSPARTPAEADSPAATAVAPATRHRHFLITEDLRLDDVLAAAGEDATPPIRPALKLLFAIVGLALGFAAALMLVARGLQALWQSLFG